MPRVGVYPLWENDLMWFLLEHFPAVSNRELLHDIILNPLHEIREEYKAEKTNPYILRERHRKWIKTVDKYTWLDTPDWEEAISDEYWESDACPICEALFQQEAEWHLIGDSSDLVHELVDEVSMSFGLRESATGVIQKLVDHVGCEAITELFLAAPSLDRLYVVKSSRIEGCADVLTSKNGAHAFENIGDALLDGIHPTYVFPEETVKDFSEWVAMYNSGGAA